MKTKVIFKKIKWFHDSIETIEALFPEEIESKDCILGYAHIGQHSEIHKDFLIDGSKEDYSVKTATKKEYNDLYNELLYIGYDLEIV